MTQGSLKIWHLHIKQWDGSFTSDRRFYNSDKYTADGGEEKHALLYAAGEKTRLGNFCGREPGNSYTDLKRTQPSLSPSNLSCTYAAEHKEVCAVYFQTAGHDPQRGQWNKFGGLWPEFFKKWNRTEWNTKYQSALHILKARHHEPCY